MDPNNFAARESHSYCRHKIGIQLKDAGARGCYHCVCPVLGNRPRTAARVFAAANRPNAHGTYSLNTGHSRARCTIFRQSLRSRIGRLTPPVNDRFTFERSTRTFFRFFPGGFGGRPYLLDTIEEQIAAMFLVEWHRIIVAQSGRFYPGSDQHPAIEEVGRR